MSQVSLVQCDGCGERAEFVDGAKPKAKTDEILMMLSHRCQIGNVCFHICSYDCATKAIKAVLKK
jgi:hypothetical protein